HRHHTASLQVHRTAPSSQPSRISSGPIQPAAMSKSMQPANITSVYQLQGSWVLNMDAARRYLGKGHGLPGCEPLPPMPGSGTTNDDRRTLVLAWIRREEQEQGFSRTVRMRMLPQIRRMAPDDIKKQLIIPCSTWNPLVYQSAYLFRRLMCEICKATICRVPHGILGTYLDWQVIIPTFAQPPKAASTSGKATVEVYSQDYARRDIFIKGCNSLIADEELRKEVGLTEADFTFKLVKVEELRVPMFAQDELKELLENPSLAELYGMPASMLLGLAATPQRCKKLDEAIRDIRQANTRQQK
ncbi:hypothetical protein BV20DRAFT_1107610, partial [Pilatotrama ljubarskyi]